MPHRARWGDGRRADNASSTRSTLRGSVIAAMRSAGASGRNASEDTLGPRSNCVERLAQVAAQIVGVLHAHRKPHQRIADTELGAQRGWNRAMRHERRMLDQAFDAAEALGKREKVT